MTSWLTSGLGVRAGVSVCVRGAWRLGEELFCEVSLWESRAGAGGGYGIHPVLLDAALHGMVVQLGDGGVGGVGGGGVLRLPFVFQRGAVA